MITICTNKELIARQVDHADDEIRARVADGIVPSVIRTADAVCVCKTSPHFSEWQGGRLGQGCHPLVHWSEPAEAEAGRAVSDAIDAVLAEALAAELGAD